MSNEIANKGNTEVEKKMDFDKFLSEKLTDVNDALPENFNKARFVQNTLAFMGTDKGKEIMTKYGNQTVTGLLKGAYLGLDFLNKECYLVPFGKELNFMIDYRGAKKLAKKYSIRPITEISAEVVRAEDEFQYWVENGKPMFTFKPKLNSKSDVKGAFAYVLYADGNTLVDYMTLDELEMTRSKSKAKNYGAWKDYTNEMYKKVVLHRLCKQIEIEFDNPSQKESFDEDMQIETDPKEIRKNEVEENANVQDFTEVVIEESAADEV